MLEPRKHHECRRLMIGQAKAIEDEFFGSSSYMRTATLFQAGKRVNIAPSFQEILQHDYFSNIITGDVDGAQQQMIDKWCSEQTEGLLSSFPVKQTDVGSANLFVANYFNGRWVQEFDKESTKEEPFKGGVSSTVNMMNMTDNEGAITSGSFMTLSEVMNPTEAYFYADHPFAYIIQDPFDSYCFMGTFWGAL